MLGIRPGLYHSVYLRLLPAETVAIPHDHAQGPQASRGVVGEQPKHRARRESTSLRLTATYTDDPHIDDVGVDAAHAVG